MSTLSLTRAPVPPVFLFLLTILLLGGVYLWLPEQVARGDDLFLPGAEFFARTSPPPELAIELTDEQVADLTAAYEHGFDHPDPGRGDPCERLRLLSHKKLSAWRRQFSRRGFTMDKVRDLLANGRRQAVTHPQKGTTYTKISDPRGNWIIVDFVDCVIWQVAPYNFK